MLETIFYVALKFFGLYLVFVGLVRFYRVARVTIRWARRTRRGLRDSKF